MPRPRMTPQQKREKAFILALARGATEKELKYDKDVAAAVGIDKQAYCRHKRNEFQGLKLADFSRMAIKLGFSGREVCAIVGVPYEKEAEE